MKGLNPTQSTDNRDLMNPKVRSDLQFSCSNFSLVLEVTDIPQTILWEEASNMTPQIITSTLTKMYQVENSYNFGKISHLV